VTSSPPSRQVWFKTAALALALVALAWTFRDVRVERVAGLLGRLGALGVVAVLACQAAAMTFDTLGFRAAFAMLGARANFRALLWVRVATEALVLAVPGGAVVAEPIKVPLLRRQAKLELTQAIAGVVARKYLLLAGQGLWIGLSALLRLFIVWRTHAPEQLAGFVALVGLAGACVAGAALLLRLLLSRGTIATRLKGWLGRVPSQVLRQKLLHSQVTFKKTDGKLAQFFAGRRSREAGALLLLVGAWAAETLETFLCLRLLGVELSFGVVATMEVSMTLLRNVAFVVPAGIGIQDAGYALFLRALGVADATELAAAFTLLKRSKELALVALGLGLLSTDQALQRRADAAAAIP